MLDEASLQSLQIFADELHPSNMGIGKTKEGFSIYGMMQAQCTTQMVSSAHWAHLDCVHTGACSVAGRCVANFSFQLRSELPPCPCCTFCAGQAPAAFLDAAACR